MRGLVCLLSLIWTLAAVPIATARAALPVAFTTIADSNTAIPGGAGNFTIFETYSIDASGIAFVADGAGSPGPQVGIYTWSGGQLARVADRNTIAPGSGGLLFSDLDHVSISNGQVAFHGWTGGDGVYLASNGTISRLADRGTPVPGGTGLFSSVEGETPISNGSVAFWASAPSGQFGIYRRTGATTSALVNEDTLVPGAGIPFRYINGDSVAMRNGSTVAFAGVGTDDQWGLYRIHDSVVSAIADSRGTLPDIRGTLLVGGVFEEPAVDGDQVVFAGRYTNDMVAPGLFLDSNGILEEIIAPRTPVPGGSGFFTGLRQASLSHGRVVFWGLGSQGEEGIYLYAGGLLEKIIAVGDPLGGSTVLDLFAYGHEGYADGYAVFQADLANGVKGLYRADLTAVPLPATGGLLFTGCLAAATYARRRSGRHRPG